MEIVYRDDWKELPPEALLALFKAVGWSDGGETPEQRKNFSIGFRNSTYVVSAWEGERLVGAVRVLSDGIFRSVIYDLLVDPPLQGRGIGRELLRRCVARFPDSEWLVETTPEKQGFYEKAGFSLYREVVLSMPCKLFAQGTVSDCAR